ncbi:polymorphic toxin-type HINT domain-containing protein, partial [Nocardiopsis sediminis]
GKKLDRLGDIADGGGNDRGNGDGNNDGDGSDSDGNGEDEERNDPSCTPGNSFVPGTPVLLADGTTRPIEDVAVGDEVLAFDPLTGEEGPREVTDLISGAGEKTLVTLTIDDGQGTTGTLTATDAHPFWVPGQAEWVDAIDLEPGTWLRTSTGTWTQITAVDTHTAQAQQVHNLTIADLHTYYVGAGSANALVHNANCDRLYEGPGFQHVLDEHVSGSPGVTPENTLFKDYYDPDDIGDLIEETVQNSEGRPNTSDPETGMSRDGSVHTLEFDYPVGTTQGNPPEDLYSLQVVVNPDGTLRTAFPVR